MSHIWMRHVTHMNESCHMSWRCGTVTVSKKLVRHVTCPQMSWVVSRLTESCHTCLSHVALAWFMSHSHESCHIWRTYGFVTASRSWWFMWHMNESCHTCMSHVTDEGVMKESYHARIRHVSMTNKTCLIHERVASRHDSFICHIWVRYCLKKLVIHVTYEWVMSHE